MTPTTWTVLPVLPTAPMISFTGMVYVDPQETARCAAEAETRRINAENDRQVSAYFEALGYEVSTDWSHYGAIWWHEICDIDGLVCQIDHGVPLAAIVEDFTAMSGGAEQGTSKSDYTICSEPGCPRFFNLLQRVAKNQMGGVQENLPL